MATWILKTEPSTYSFQDLLNEKKTLWDGVRNPNALKNIRSMNIDDRIMIYHTGDEKRIVGLAAVASQPYPDPHDASLSVVSIKAVRWLKKPVSLSQVKQDARLEGFALVRQGRLSVVPVPERIESILLQMAGELQP